MGGPLLILIFSASQAVRDILFPHLFQHHGFFDVVLIVFVSATICGWTVLFLREPEQISRLFGQWQLLSLISCATAVGWISYFFALTHIEPAVANTLFSGSGPFVVILAAFISGNQTGPITRRRQEQFFYAGLFLTLMAMVYVTVSGKSGLESTTPWYAFFGSLAAIASGSLIAISLLISRRLNEAGLSANAVMAARFVMGAVVSSIILGMQLQPSGINADWMTGAVVVAALCFIVLPSYALQIGVSKTAPLTVQVIVSLSPVLVFVGQWFDGRTHYASATLICLVFYGVFIVALNVLRGWHSDPANPK